jgi:hypothetical protein
MSQDTQYCDRRDRHRYWQKLISHRGPRCARRCRAPAKVVAWPSERVEGMSNEIEAIARQDAGWERLMSVLGVGPIISSAMVAAIGAGDVFTKGRSGSRPTRSPRQLRREARATFAINYDGNPDQDGRPPEPALQLLRLQSWYTPRHSKDGICFKDRQSRYRARQLFMHCCLAV